MNIGVPGLISSTFADSLTMVRNRPGEWVSMPSGVDEFVQGEPFLFTAMVSIQTLTGSERLLLPEGDRLKEALKLYSHTELYCSRQNPKQEPDTFAFLGRRFVIVSCEKWSTYWKAMAVCLDPAEPLNNNP